MFHLPQHQEVMLLSMPWVSPTIPSIQLGILDTLLNRAGHKVCTFSAFLPYFDFLVRLKIVENLGDFQKIALLAQSEWVFSGQDFRGGMPLSEDPVRLQLEDDQFFEQLKRVKDASEAFLDTLAEEIVQAGPQIVGFTTTFPQTVASLAVAKKIKAQRPEIMILLGGNQCEALTGEALLKCFPWVDVIVHGEAEGIIEDLVERMLSGRLQGRLKGVSYRGDDGLLTLNGSERNTSSIENFVVPNYREYFDTLEMQSTILGEVKNFVSIPFENNRGCWWGQKHHCTFCALNGESMVFRSKSPEQAVQDLHALSSKYQHFRFHSVDNILDYKYFGTFLKELANSDEDREIFFETKSNIGLMELIQMRQAGILSIQPGIESLSTYILKLINKGVTAIQNLRLLKYCTWLGIEVHWNIIYGFPGESVQDYTRMVDILQSIPHFQPGDLVRLALQRYSPYHKDPQKFGLKIIGPAKFYESIYAISKEDIESMALYFDYTYEDGQDPENYIGPMKEATERWARGWPHAKKSLRYYRVNSGIVITDTRPTVEATMYKLGPIEALIYLACEDIISIQRLLSLNFIKQAGLNSEDVEAFCEQLLEARLLFREGDQLLSLAIPTRDAMRSMGMLNEAAPQLERSESV